jgi:hypothetical protein
LTNNPSQRLPGGRVQPLVPPRPALLAWACLSCKGRPCKRPFPRRPQRGPTLTGPTRRPLGWPSKTRRASGSSLAVPALSSRDRPRERQERRRVRDGPDGTGQRTSRTHQVTPIRPARGRTDSRQPALAGRRRWPHRARHTQPGSAAAGVQPLARLTEAMTTTFSGRLRPTRVLAAPDGECHPRTGPHGARWPRPPVAVAVTL